jgi:methionine-rich copper-binding protein CopC
VPRRRGHRSVPNPLRSIRALLLVALASLAAGLIGVAVGAVTAPGPAAAHDELVRTAPAAGTKIAAPPATVQLVFGEPARATGSAVVVTGPGGARVSTGALVVTNATVIQPVRITTAGVYKVNWRVVSADGHPVTGTFSFTVMAAPAANVPGAASPVPSGASSAVGSATPSVSGTTGASTGAPTGASASASGVPAPGSAPPNATDAALSGTTAAAADQNGDVGSALPWILVIAALVIAVVVGIALLMRRRAAGSA